MKTIETPQYTIYFQKEGYTKLNEHIKKSRYSAIFILVDENTHQYCLPKLMSKLAVTISVKTIKIKAGEQYKNMETCLSVWRELSQLGADGKSLLINLGGGVVTDLGGFTASTFKRGIDFINIPTTLLGIVDASIGGKTGVNVDGLKNEIGVIKQPKLIVADGHYLETLSERHIKNGFAEMLKHGLIADKKYWEELSKLSNLKIENLERFIQKSIEIKNDIVLQDPTEQNLRKTLNFGHTLGHAIESYFLEEKNLETLLHGEAIAIGLILEGFISTELENFPKEQLHQIKSVVSRFFSTIIFSKEDIQHIITLVKHDKKNSYGKTNVVLLKTIGEPVLDRQVNVDLLTAAFQDYNA